MKAPEKITEIENELKDILTYDKKSWVRIYELMDEVNTNRLFEDKYKSFTAWVNDFAENKAKVHVSLLWERLKAGRFYAKYQKRSAAKGNTAESLDKINVAPTTLVLAEKIAGTNEQVADDLIEKIIKGSMTRNDLKNAWLTVKGQREKAGFAQTRKNSKEHFAVDFKGHLKGHFKEYPDGTYDFNSDAVYKTNTTDEMSAEKSANIAAEMSAEITAEITAEMTATDIVFTLNQNNNWITNRIDNRFYPSKYKLFSEFAVHPGTTLNARRIDALVIETISVQSKTSEVALHGIEIKVSKSDLLKDQKMEEYTPFCDYFWLAVPENLEIDAQSIMAKGWGLLLIDRVHKTIKVSVQAIKHEAVAREETISTALLKIL